MDDLFFNNKFTKTFARERGLKSDDEISNFLKKEWKDPDISCYSDMKVATDILLNSVKNKERIGIFGDYDCDGICSSAILYSTLYKLNHKDVIYHTPNRNVEGFGLNDRVMDDFIKQKIKTLVIFDCGTNEKENIQKLKSKGIKVIIIDHHIGDNLANPDALINPIVDKVEGAHPCSAGLSFLFSYSIVREANKNGIDIKLGWERWQLDLASLATISDMVPILGINRIIVHNGVYVFNKSKRAGIQALCKLLKIKQSDLNAVDLSFLIIPKINAASRMGDAEIAFKLLVEANQEKAFVLAKKLLNYNSKRRARVAQIVKSAKKQAETKNKDRDVWVLGNREWEPSFVGLVAQKIMDDYKKTCFVWGVGGANNDKIKGSCRSFKHNVFEIMKGQEESFVEYGGHKRAGGFTIKNGKEVVIEKELNNLSLKEDLEDDGKSLIECSVCDIKDVYEVLKVFAPFGVANNEPLFIFKNCSLVDVKDFGLKGVHKNIKIQDNTGIVDAVFFFADDIKTEKKHFDIEGNILFDNYRKKIIVKINSIY